MHISKGLIKLGHTDLFSCKTHANVHLICAIMSKAYQLILCDETVGSLKPRLYSLGRFSGKLDRRLQQIDGELRVGFRSDPTTEIIMY